MSLRCRLRRARMMPAREWTRSSREPVTTLGPPGPEHGTTCPIGHACPKPVFLRPSPVVRLECPLHDYLPAALATNDSIVARSTAHSRRQRAQDEPSDHGGSLLTSASRLRVDGAGAQLRPQRPVNQTGACAKSTGTLGSPSQRRCTPTDVAATCGCRSSSDAIEPSVHRMWMGVWMGVDNVERRAYE